MVRYIIAVVLLMHGIGHIMPFMASWTSQKVGFSNASWFFSSGVSVNGPVGQAFGLLALLALLGFSGGAIGLLLHQSWWPAMTLSATMISLVSILPWLGAWPLSSAIGALIVDGMILIALLPSWAEHLTHSIS